MEYIFKNKSSNKTIILLHGTGGDEYSLLDLANAIDPNANVLSIRGSITEGTLNRYFKRFSQSQVDLDSFKAESIKLSEFIDQLLSVKNLNQTSICLIGFSNGANIIEGMLKYRIPQVFRFGLLAPTHIEETRPFLDLTDRMVFLSMASNDPLVEQDSLNRLAQALLQAQAQLTHLPHDDGHSVSKQVINALIKWYELF